MRIFVSKGIAKGTFHHVLNTHFLGRKDVTLFNKNLVHEMKSADQLYNIKNLEKTLDKPDFALVVLSKEYIKDGWLQAELNCLCVIEQMRGTRFIIPVLADSIEESALPKYFSNKKDDFIDIRHISEEDGADKVAQHISNMTLHHKAVFIGHGRSSTWKDLRDILKERLHLPYNEFNGEPQAGKSNKEVLMLMLQNSNFAFLIMTAEDEHPDKTLHARENVIHEVGLFQGKLGFERAIILIEDGCQEFSNINGLTQIKFSPGKLEASYLQILDVLEREGIV